MTTDEAMLQADERLRTLSAAASGGIRAGRGRRGLVRRLLPVADLTGLLAAYALAAVALAGTDWGSGAAGGRTEILLFVASLPLWLGAAKVYGLYERDVQRPDHSTVDELVSFFHIVTVGVWVFYVGSRVTGVFEPDPYRLVVFWLCAVPVLGMTRAAARAAAKRHASYAQRAVIVGAGDVGQLVGRKFLQHPEYGIDLVGFVDADPKERRTDVNEVRVLGGLEELPRLVDDHSIERVVVAFSNESHEQLLGVIRSLGTLDVRVDVVPRLFEALGPQIDIHSVEGMPLIALPPARFSRSSRIAKRAIDLVGAVVGLVATAPVFAVVAALIKLDSPGPVFFRQVRVGGQMRRFTVLKFRTMAEDTDDTPHRAYIRRIMDSKTPVEDGSYKLERRDAVTRVGRLLRRTSLDELPQLLNVLRGDMSLVGPRPCIPYELEHFAPHHFERFLVPAGLTGLWQVSARARATFVEALDLDVAYARGWSLALDVRLLFRTPLALFRGGTR